jgi:glyoxylase-like metal-dependent hydrolase (beta-lactamase superfamily II)
MADAIIVHAGADGGRYPDGNALLVRGSSETVLIDPSLTIAANPPPGVDRILISHAHEDHLAGLARYPDVAVHVHAADAIGLQSLDGLMQIYGMAPDVETKWRAEVVEKFHYAPRPDARTFSDGDVFDLGNVRLRVVHLPGHTRGHAGFYIDPDVMFLADVDLTGFGPYYGDAWSSLDDWDRTLQRCREIDARRYVTFHHKGTVDGRAAFLELLERYEAVLPRREQAMLEYLSEPRTVAQMAQHRFVYRAHVQLLFADAVERRSAQLHLDRFLARGQVSEVEPGRFMRTGRAERPRAG